MMPIRRDHDRGDSFVGTMLALAVVILATAFVMPIILDALRISQAHAAADQMRILHQATLAYVRKNITDVVTTVAAGPEPITLATLKAEDLQATFPTRNPYGGTYQTCVAREINGLLKIVNSANGGVVPRKFSGRYMLRGGAGTAAVMDYDNDSIARGAYGSINDNLASLAPNCAVPPRGAEAMITWVDPAALGADDGYRVVQILQVAHDDLIDKPDCPGTGTPGIHLTQTTSAGTDPAEVIAAEQVWADDVSATQWQARHRVLTETGWNNPPATIARLTAILVCSP
jgi:type II secretory pathway pseudopilin PulG